jgi:hypothetical protein
MKVVRFLERKQVIQFFGLALILAPFINTALHILILKAQNHMTWKQINLIAYLKTGNLLSFFLALCSVAIGCIMLRGSVTAWKYVLGLIGTHLLVQVLNINNKAWSGPLAWPSFLLNASLFYFIIDQLVWKVHAPAPSRAPSVSSQPIRPERKVIHLKSHRKILFSFGSEKPWGELKTLSSEWLAVKNFAEVPKRAETEVIQINFAKDVVVEIRFSHCEGQIYYFTPLNMDKNLTAKLNRWLRKIAV